MASMAESMAAGIDMSAFGKAEELKKEYKRIEAECQKMYGLL